MWIVNGGSKLERFFPPEKDTHKHILGIDIHIDLLMENNQLQEEIFTVTSESAIYSEHGDSLTPIPVMQHTCSIGTEVNIHHYYKHLCKCTQPCWQWQGKSSYFSNANDNTTMSLPHKHEQWVKQSALSICLSVWQHKNRKIWRSTHLYMYALNH